MVQGTRPRGGQAAVAAEGEWRDCERRQRQGAADEGQREWSLRQRTECDGCADALVPQDPKTAAPKKSRKAPFARFTAYISAFLGL